MAELQQLYKIEEVAKLLKVSRKTIYNYINAGKLQTIHIGRNVRISGDEYNRFINAGVDPIPTGKTDKLKWEIPDIVEIPPEEGAKYFPDVKAEK